MNERRLRKKFNISRSKLVIVGCSIFLVLFVVGFIKEKLNGRQVDADIADLEEQIKPGEKENAQFAALIKEWQDGSRMEKEARLKLGLKKPGEEAVIIMREQTKVENPLMDSVNTKIVGGIIESQSEDKSNFTKWVEYFFHKQ